jgi:hypothetical protein
LTNFQTNEERYFAACVLDALIFRSEQQTISLFRHLFLPVIPDLARIEPGHSGALVDAHQGDNLLNTSTFQRREGGRIPYRNVQFPFVPDFAGMNRMFRSSGHALGGSGPQCFRESLTFRRVHVRETAGNFCSFFSAR